MNKKRDYYRRNGNNSNPGYQQRRNSGEQHEGVKDSSTERVQHNDAKENTSYKENNFRKDNSHHKDGTYQRDQRDQREGASRQPYHNSNNTSPRYQTRVKAEETIDDIIVDIARIEKEIQLELKEIKSLRLGL